MTGVLLQVLTVGSSRRLPTQRGNLAQPVPRLVGVGRRSRDPGGAAPDPRPISTVGDTDERLEQRATRAAHDPAGCPSTSTTPQDLPPPPRPPQDERACLAPTGPGTVETTPPVDAEDNPHPHLT
ncbi:hypothetical protein GS426_00060 [Rhodococcus hoagii]|nr:hypothetical protein [Prescottella equi]